MSSGTDARAACDVAVVGGGVIGLAAAWRMAQRGASVSVVDPLPGTGASHAAAGMLCPVTEVHYGEEPLLALNLESARRWPSFAVEVAEASGLDVGHRTDGTLAVAFDDDDLRALEELARFQQALGLSVERLSSRQCRTLEPRLTPRVRGGLLAEGDHQVDNRRLVAALDRACARQGVQMVPRRATSVDDGHVVLDGGDLIRADRIVVAAGCWSASLLPALPVRPVKGQILRLAFDPEEPPIARNVRGLAAGRSVYLVARADGELVVGATVEELGHDTTVTAGAVHELLRAAIDLVPAVAEIALVEVHAGLRPGTPDNAPIIGVAPDDPRVVHATGHYRNGILLAPVTAAAVTEIVLDDVTPPVVAPFGIERFARCA